MLLQCEALGAEPYQRIANMMQYNFYTKYWNETKEKRKAKIAEGFKLLYGHKPNKNIDANQMYISMANLLNMIIQNQKSEHLPLPKIPQSKAKDINGWSQRDIIKIIKGKNLKETAQKFTKLKEMKYSYTEQVNFFFKKKKK